MMPRFVKHAAKKAAAPRVSPEQARFAAQQAALQGARERSKNQADRQRVARAAVQQDLKNRHEAAQAASVAPSKEEVPPEPKPKKPARVRREG
jgi:hypothetical protein